MIQTYTQDASAFKALSDPNRLMIVDYLAEGEICACKLLEQLQISQSTLSYHMKTLTQSGVVKARKEGKWMHYSLNKEVIQKLNSFISKFM